jgi:polar amino acid transport system substrate-binding protein
MARLARRLLANSAVLAIAVMVVSCGGAPTTAGNSVARVKPPATITTAGKIVWCTDPTYPPLEFMQGSTIVGADADVGKRIAELMGVGSVMLTTQFDGLIAALLSHHCDAVLSGLYTTAERKKAVNFVVYEQDGNVLVVKAGNPEHITGMDATLGGKLVGDEAGSASIPELEKMCQSLTSLGVKPCRVIPFPGDSDAANALLAGKIDAQDTGITTISYRIEQNPGNFEYLPKLLDTSDAGIAVAKDNSALQSAIQQAVDLMYSDGSMCKILSSWKMQGAARVGATC